jgi:hypothetical protein
MTIGGIRSDSEARWEVVFRCRRGPQEILDRRVGANELDAIAICRGYVEVQHEYALTRRNGASQYAQRIISTPGKRDGLAWKNEDAPGVALLERRSPRRWKKVTHGLNLTMAITSRS